MNLKSLKIKRNEYINILKNRGFAVSDNISMGKLLRRIKYLRENDFRNLATLRNTPITNDMTINGILNTLYKDLHKKKQDAIANTLERLNLHRPAKMQNISVDEVNETTRLNDMSLNYLKKIAKLRSVKSFSNLRKEDLIYTLLRTEKSLYENNYTKNTSDDRIKKKARIVRKKLDRLGNIIIRRVLEKNCVR